MVGTPRCGVRAQRAAPTLGRFYAAVLGSERIGFIFLPL
jgi:hypothetical protein